MPLLRRPSDKVDLLREVPLFSGLNNKELAEVARHADEVQAEEGETIANQGELGNEMFVIVDGSVTVRRDGTDISTRGPGDFIGEMSLLDGQPRSASVITTKDSVLLVMHRSEFSQLLDDVPGLARKILAGLSQRIREADAKLVD